MDFIALDFESRIQIGFDLESVQSKQNEANLDFPGISNARFWMNKNQTKLQITVIFFRCNRSKIDRQNILVHLQSCSSGWQTVLPITKKTARRRKISRWNTDQFLPCYLAAFFPSNLSPFKAKEAGKRYRSLENGDERRSHPQSCEYAQSPK